MTESRWIDASGYPEIETLLLLQPIAINTDITKGIEVMVVSALLVACVTLCGARRSSSPSSSFFHLCWGLC